MKLSVLMPVYNESATLEEIVRRVEAVPIDKEIILVDNCSDDGTRDILTSWVNAGRAAWADDGSTLTRLRIYFQPENRGKGSSVRCALCFARGDWVIVQDADLEYDPRDYAKLLSAGEKSRKRVAVFGNRLQRGSLTRSGQKRNAFYYGRVGLSSVFRLLYGRPLSDVATCYKLLPRTLALSLQLQSDGFDLDFEIAGRLARRGVRIVEVPISYQPRTAQEGKKIRVVRDGLRAMQALLKYRFL
jgi:glycosyltransferase involved in cell wall biosynthesis